MKILKFKLFLAITFATALTFTSCSKEDITTTDTTDLVSGNEEATEIKDYWVQVDDLNNIDWEAVEAARIEGQEIDSRCPGCALIASPISLNDCTAKICATIGPASSYTVEGAGTFYGPDQLCVTIPINPGDSRDANYVGTGGVVVQQYRNDTDQFPLLLWSVPPSVNSPTVDETTLTLSYCGTY